MQHTITKKTNIINCKIMTKQLLLLCSFLVAHLSLYAAPAIPSPIKFAQPNGDTLTITLHGDEFSSYAQSTDNYTLLYNKEGYLTYAQKNGKGDIEPSNYIAKAVDKRTTVENQMLQFTPRNLTYSSSQKAMTNQIKNSIQKQARVTRAFPTAGTHKLLCILMEFKDVHFSITNPQQAFNNLFNQINYNLNGQVGSVKDYFAECSYGKLNLQVDVVGPFRADSNMVYYGGNIDDNNKDVNVRDLISEAFYKADSSVDYTDYDNDNDGYVDGTYVIFAGYGEEACGVENTIWSHAWSTASTINLDGVNMSRYSCSPELSGYSGTNMTYIGVICHEFGHVLGAPDFYDTNYSTNGQFQGLGRWDLQSSGSWNGVPAGSSPAHPNPYTKVYIYDWANIHELDSTISVTLNTSYNDSNAFYRVNTQTRNEYYILENRQQQGFDGSIPGRGMMIYHAHADMSGRNINITHPQGFYPVSANAPVQQPDTNSTSYGVINSTSCPWPGTNQVRSISDFTTPSLCSWNGELNGITINNITENSTTGIVTFNFIQDNPRDFKVTDVTENSITLDWLKNNNRDVVILASTSAITTSLTNSNNYPVGTTVGSATVIYNGGGNNFIYTGLVQDTEYHFKIFTKLTNTPTWSGGITMSQSTMCLSIKQFPYIIDFEVLDNATGFPPCTSMETLDGNDWRITDSVNSSFPNRTLEYYFNSSKAANTWFYSQGLYLNAGGTYTFTFDYGIASSQYPESMRLCLGRTPMSNSMTDTIFDNPNIVSYVFDTTATFIPPTTGIYYLGIQCYSATDMFRLYVDNIEISEQLPPSPEVTIINAALNPFNECNDNIRSTQNFTISGLHIKDSITLYAPSGFEISTMQNSNFQPWISLVPQSGVVGSQNIYVKMISSTLGNHRDSIRIETMDITPAHIIIVGTVSTIPTITPLINPGYINSGNTISIQQPTVTDNYASVSAQGFEIYNGTTWNSFDLSTPLTMAHNGQLVRYYATNGCGTNTSDTITLEIYESFIAIATVTPFEYETCTGNQANKTKFNIYGHNLTHDIVITAPSGYEISDQVNGIFVPVLNLTPNNGEVSSEVYISLVRTNIGFIIDTLHITSVGANSYSIPLFSKIGEEPIIDALQQLDSVIVGTNYPLNNPNIDNRGFLISNQGWELYNNNTWTIIEELLLLEEHDGLSLRYFASNKCGTTYTEPITLNVKAPVGIEYNIQENWIIYPNPAKEQIHIIGSTIEAGTVMRIYNSNGSLVMSHTADSDPIIINIATLPQGIYTLIFNQTTLRFIKQ